jgi:hypothetical protein
METKKRFIEFMNRNQAPTFDWFETYARENIKDNFQPIHLQMYLQVCDMSLLISNLCDKFNLCLLYDKNGGMIKVIN